MLKSWNDVPSIAKKCRISGRLSNPLTTLTLALEQGYQVGCLDRIHILAHHCGHISVNGGEGFPRVVSILKATPGHQELPFFSSQLKTVIHNIPNAQNNSLRGHVLADHRGGPNVSIAEGLRREPCTSNSSCVRRCTTTNE
ncbi:unnamed protein product [Phytophthora fragariaefolia]|uniref:Unnamed protein product n=1 Tax=Phytophthora fragariaefolia TaxID=1490495 RepID=A0A9W7CT35_9STRA|nr:unnamed protein product [Phytophthora fragariaefolia]